MAFLAKLSVLPGLDAASARAPAAGWTKAFLAPAVISDSAVLTPVLLCLISFFFPKEGMICEYHVVDDALLGVMQTYLDLLITTVWKDSDWLDESKMDGDSCLAWVTQPTEGDFSTMDFDTYFMTLNLEFFRNCKQGIDGIRELARTAMPKISPSSAVSTLSLPARRKALTPAEAKNIIAGALNLPPPLAMLLAANQPNNPNEIPNESRYPQTVQPSPDIGVGAPPTRSDQPNTLPTDQPTNQPNNQTAKQLPAIPASQPTNQPTTKMMILNQNCPHGQFG